MRQSLYMNPVVSTLQIGAVKCHDSILSVCPLPQSVEQQMGNKYFWHLYSGKYLKQKWNVLMRHFMEIQVEQMQLSDNEYSPVLKEISQVAFPRLVSLSLISNNIQSIESLAFADMPELLYFHISRNRIARVGPLRKAKWPKLTRLIMNDNPIADCEAVLPYCQFPQLQFVVLQGWMDSLVFATDISFVAKLQSQKLRYLNVNSDFRVRQFQVKSQLLSKFEQIKVIFSNQQ